MATRKCFVLECSVTAIDGLWLTIDCRFDLRRREQWWGETGTGIYICQKINVISADFNRSGRLGSSSSAAYTCMALSCRAGKSLPWQGSMPVVLQLSFLTCFTVVKLCFHVFVPPPPKSCGPFEHRNLSLRIFGSGNWDLSINVGIRERERGGK